MNRPNAGFTILAVIALVFLISTGGPVSADYPGSEKGIVFPHFCDYNYSRITSTSSVPMGATSATKYTDKVILGRTEQQSIAVTLTTTQSVSMSIPIQVSYDGTNWSTEQTVTLAFSSTVNTDFAALNLPVASMARVALTSHATYPTTYTAVVLNGW